MILLIISAVMERLVSPTKYEMPKIIKFSMMFKSEVTATLFVITIILLLLVQIKLIKISNFMSLRNLFILVTHMLDLAITLSMLLVPIRIMICLLESSFIVILSIDFINLVNQKFEKCFFDLNNIFDITLGGLSIRRLVEISI